MHVVIVGAGPGGLLTAINLAGLGLRVTVVEKDAVPGGRMKGLTLGDQGQYVLDTGPTILQVPEVLQQIFARAGKSLGDYAKLLPVEPMTRTHFWDGSVIDTTIDHARMAEQLARFGDDKPAAFERWMADARDKYEFMYRKFITSPADSLAYFMPWLNPSALRFRPWQSLYRHFDSHFHDERINYALAFPSKYLGLHPTTASSLFSIVPYLELMFGLWHVRGGLVELTRGMKRCAEDLGATFRMSAPVASIEVEEGVARGVKLESGELVEADTVVVNADLPYAATHLLDERWRAGTKTSDAALDRAAYSCSTFMLYLGLDKVYDVPHHLIHFSDNSRRTDPAYLEDREPDYEGPAFYVCNPTPSDPTCAPEGHSTLYVAVPLPNTRHPVDFAEAERRMNELVPRWLAKVGIDDIERHIVVRRSYQSTTWRDQYNVHHGAVFSLAHRLSQLGPMRPKIRHPKVRGLYWVGGGVHPGSGLLAIMESSNIAASFVAKDAGTTLPQWPYIPSLDEGAAARANA